MEASDIGWLHRSILRPDGSTLLIKGNTFNTHWGCFKVAQECKYCYAEGLSLRFYGQKIWGPATTTSRKMQSDSYWQQIPRWNARAEKLGHRVSVFCNSMSDVFEDHPDIVQARTLLFMWIENTPWLNYLLLTKRPENMLTMVPEHWKDGWPDNVWAGMSAGTQSFYDEHIDAFVEVPAVVRFISNEPGLEEVTFGMYLEDLDWVISGGESGKDARPYHLNWSRSTRDQCQEAGVPFFFKQVGGRTHATGGRLLDGQTWDEMPPEFPSLDQIVCRWKQPKLMSRAVLSTFM